MAWVLEATNESIEVVLDGAVTTNELQCVAHWADVTGALFTEGMTAVETNGATPVTLVAAPAAGTRRLISDFSIYNADTVDQAITLHVAIGGTDYVVYKSDLVVDATILMDGTVIGGQAFSAKFPPSATDPVAPPPLEGDVYYNTVLDMIMMYDSTRTKWLSIESNTFQMGRDGLTTAGNYYRMPDGLIASAIAGYAAHFNGTIVSFSYTRSDVDAATFVVTEDGVSRATLASTAVVGQATNLDADITQGGVLAVQNQAGGNTTSDGQCWVRVKWRI